MAEELTAKGHWTPTQTRSQFGAIAWLRWRILVNSFRRKGGKGELVGIILVYPIFGLLILTLVLGAGVVAWALVAKGYMPRISWMLWGIFILCQLLNIQLGQAGTTFDPTQLIRFPLGTRTYVVIRLFFGMLSPANIVGTLMSLAVAVGVSVAAPRLWLYAFLALAAFAAANVLFSRMIFAWVDRWLSTRRAREVFTGFIFVFSLGIQWANFTFNPAYNHHHTQGISHQRLDFAQKLYHHAQPILAILPPELTATALVTANRSAIAASFGYILACAAFAGLFLLVFALRMRTEYRGESLSDAANGVGRGLKAVSKPMRAATALAPSAPMVEATSTGGSGIQPVVAAILGKELLHIRRTMGVLYGLIMPIFLVLIFASKFASRGNAFWLFPAAVGYTLLAVGPLSYNAFGLEAAGAQFYFLAPVRMRDILFAKNIFGFLMAFLEIFAVFCIISYLAGLPSASIAIAAFLWAAGTLAFNTIVGNRRSITAPKKINTQRMANKQTSQLSAFLSLGILMVCGVAAVGFYGLAFWLGRVWIIVPIFTVFAAAGIFFYLRSLSSLDKFALDHREEFLAELTKQS